MDDLLRDFLTETHENIDVVDVELVRFEQEPNNHEILAKVFRLVHTIKGTCSFVGLPRLEALAHAAEALMGRFRDGMPVTSDAVSLILVTIDRIKEILAALERTRAEPAGGDDDLIHELERIAGTTPATSGALDRPMSAGASEPAKPAARTEAAKHAEEEFASRRKAESSPRAEAAAKTLRVQVETLEHLMTMVSELVLTRNQLIEIMRRNEDSEFKVPLQRLSHVTVELQEGVMKTRMQPIGKAWSKLPRVVRDLAAELGKEIELEMEGSETELDRQVLELIRDPLTHMVRNAADHGLEPTEERRAAGKPDKGKIRLTACHEGGNIIIELSDDGRGLDTERIRAQAVSQGLISEVEVEKLTAAQVHKLIFAPGFSTAAAVTAVSGRGVGMDVVRNNIDEIGGTIDLKTTRGKGATFTVKIPLTLAIVSALIVEAAGERFAIPQVAVTELVRAKADSEHRIERLKDTAVLRLRDKLFPLVHLNSLLGLAGPEVSEEKTFIVVMQLGSRSFGVVVDHVFHTEEIVVKPMSAKLRHVNLFSGNTILGDGSVIMILDPNGIAAAIGIGVESSVLEAGKTVEAAAEETNPTVSLIVFRAGSQELKAVPLPLVTRLEEVDARSIERSNGRPMLQYRDSLMPLVPINAQVQVHSEGTQPLLVFMDGGRAVGLVVDEIVDIVEDRLAIEVASATPGSLGSAIIRGRATDIIDVAHFLPLAYEDWFRRKDRGPEARSRRLLFVDDSAFFRNLLAPVLQAAGYVVTTANGGEEALAILQKDTRFDVIVSDIEMPGMSGFELADAIKANPRTTHVTLIALSSLEQPAMIERGRQAGFRDFIAKFDRQGLITALAEAPTEWVEAA